MAATVSAAPTTATSQDAATIAAYGPQLQRLFSAVPQLDASLAAKYPQLAKDGKVDTKIMMSLPGDLIGSGVDLVLGIPGALIDHASTLLGIPSDIAGFVADILGGPDYDEYDGYEY